ncbi:MAG TPA: SpoIIE family protein phosphatase [Bryobacteraceae bacterium]|nr:SpoIIE family protein phosphatase [Bryobacteraceae bacterium]
MQELFISSPDGTARTIALESESITLGRSSTNVLCYPDDAGLSRQHLAIEKNADKWIVRDCGSKNGTLINGFRLGAPQVLKAGDRVTAGHLTLEFRDSGATAPPLIPPSAQTVLFVPDSAATAGRTSTLESSLEGLREGPTQGGAADKTAHMKALVDAGRELVQNKSLAELFQLIMNLSIEAVGAARGVLMTLEGEELVVRAAKGQGFRISSGVRDQVLTQRRSLLISDVSDNRALMERHSIVQQQIRSMVAVPLQTEDRVIGLIYLDSPHFIHAFTNEDLNLLTVMANIAATRIEHVRLGEVEQAERALSRELSQAAEIQQGLLPSAAPKMAGLDLAGYNVPCRTVGGDYYDYIPCVDGRVAVMVGDVAGKGMPAALLMSNLQARAQILFDDPQDLGAVVARLNRIICQNCPGNRFITFFVAVVDPKSGEMTWCNAGHNPPILIRANGEIEQLQGGGLILGIMPMAPYSHKTGKMNPGDMLVMFSDGVTEACQPGKDEEFGEDRLARLARDLRHQPAETIMRSLIDTLMKWIGGAPAADDITLIVARKTV